MTKVSAPLTNQRGRRSVIDEKLDELLEARDRLMQEIANAEAEKAAKIAKIENNHEESVAQPAEELARVDTELKAHLERHRYWLTRRHSKTIARQHGEVKVVLRAIELDKPADAKPAIDLLLSRRGWDKYLIVTYKLDLRKLLNAPSGVKAALRPLGFWWGRHLTISVKSASVNEPKVISRRRYNER